MRSFRPALAAPALPLSLDGVRALIADAFRPAHFFLAPALAVEWERREREEVVWEVFQGRLLDPAHSRTQRSFETWALYQIGKGGRAAEPLLALYLDAGAGELHVVRGLDSYAWEGYDAGNGTFLSRERRKWVRELAGTLRLEQFAHLGELRDELTCRLFHAVVGTRLPLSSVEAPLPGFSFGALFYCYRGPALAGDPLRSGSDLVRGMLTAEVGEKEAARVLEAMLRAATGEELPTAAGAFVARWKALGRTSAELTSLLRTLFNQVSLSPWTDFAEQTLAFLRHAELSVEEIVDFEGHLLRQLGRHLTAYDLVTFHHRGANYPDALLLDRLLKDYLGLARRRPDLFLDADAEREESRRARRRRRRALRQGWLLRRRYEGHLVPDLPTSPGENSRALPPSHPRVPEEQLSQPGWRRRRLYDGDPLTGADEVLLASAADLDHADERRELGAALFLDRPFGGGKAPAEPDATLLLTSLAYSRSLAEERLTMLARDLNLPDVDVKRWREGLGFAGLALDAIGGPVKPATVGLADARRSAPDFVFLSTLPGSVRALREQFDLTEWGELFEGRVLIARSATGPGIVVYDESFCPRLELEAELGAGYACRAGEEWPVGGLRPR